MLKKLFIGLSAFSLVVASIPLFAAFEAHVINVTARIENALSVTPVEIRFGTVFPEEQLNKSLTINLSQSFADEQNADDVEYIIRQKPKCAITSQNGEVADLANTATGHVSLDATDRLVIDCGPAPRDLKEGETWGPLPSLCPYLSKHPDNQPANDGSLNSFHQPWTIVNHQVVWNDVLGKLAKSQNDMTDTWNIDLKVPCFKGSCAQDWVTYVHNINPDADPALYMEDPANEHKVFGCDLWVEVTGVSRLGPEPTPTL